MALSSHQILPLLVAVFCAGAMAYYDPRELERMTATDRDDDAPPYVLQRLGAKYHHDQGAAKWETAPDPQYYVLTEGGSQGADYIDEQQQESKRVKRTNGPSLSIVNSLDVLRQRLLLEIARRRMRQSEDQILANREILKSIGKRDASQSGLGDTTHATSGGNIRTSPQSRLVKQWTVKSRNQQEQL